MPSSTLNRIPSLDGLRTVSIALVIAGHTMHVLGFGDAGNLGNLGVRIFFVISGFLICGLLLGEEDRRGSIDLLKFYFRRTLRIFPPFYFYLLVVLAATLAGVVAIPLEMFGWSALYTTDYVNTHHWWLGHSWSLAVEEQFYLILPGLLLLAGRKRLNTILIAVIVLSPIIRLVDYRFSPDDAMWVLKGFHTNMDALAAGCLLAINRTSLHSNKIYRSLIDSKWIWLFPAVIFFANNQTDHPHIFYGVSLTVMNILITITLDSVVTNFNSVAGKVLNSRPFVFLGGMSYSIYLWQQPFVDPKTGTIFSTFPYNVIGLVVMSCISYFIVEKCSLALRQRWENSLFAKDNRAAKDRLELADNTAS